MASTSTHPGLLHRIPRSPTHSADPSSPLVAFEHSPPITPQNPPQRSNTLIFLPGIADGPLTTAFTLPLVAALPASWSLIEPILGSAYKQWGVTSLNEDVAEIAMLVAYFRELRPKGRVVLLGHSTGSQMIMHYLLSPGAEGRPRIDGGGMQGSVSDREAMGLMMSSAELERGSQLAMECVRDGRAEHVLPLPVTTPAFGSAPVSARRWLSLARLGGEDDYFSSDLGEERLGQTFGRLGRDGVIVAWFYGGEDEYVHTNINKKELVQRWEVRVKKGGGAVSTTSGVIDGASHTLKGRGYPLEEFMRRVVGFLGEVERD